VNSPAQQGYLLQEKVMKYKLRKELPFMKAETIFKKASSICCGDGWAIPAKPKAQGQIADNPVTTFPSHQNQILDELIDESNWVEAIPETISEKLDLYERGTWSRDKFLANI
jgi:hypothetical protein